MNKTTISNKKQENEELLIKRLLYIINHITPSFVYAYNISNKNQK